MAKNYFLPSGDLPRVQWIKNFASKLALYAAKYGISEEEVADMVAAAVYIAYWVDFRNQNVDYVKKLTKFKNDVQNGVPPGSVLGIEPVPPTFPPPPAAVPPGIFVRAAKLGAIIKKKANYTQADGNDLGLEGSEQPQDMEKLKPVLTIRLVSGGKPQLSWKKQRTNSLEIHVDRGDGNFVLLATNTSTKYIDNTALPTGATSALWKYKAIYRFNNANVGEWSDVATITVS